jgi:preprotein translocase subunit SecA
MAILKSLFGNVSKKELKKINPIVKKINSLSDEYKALTDAELQAKTPEFKQRLADGETLDDILPEAFAAVREAADRVLGMRPYDVQLIGGIVLHKGMIAEMRTGEGKTLVATLPAYLNALTGKGVHVITVNDYLAKRDSEWMGKVHRFMGLTVGLVIHDITGADRKASYQADITYGTNNEFGFDYLRDNMAIYDRELVQRGHAFCIVDEVDSILIDEARTPLIISGQGDKASDQYSVVDQFVCTLHPLVVAKQDSKVDEAESYIDLWTEENVKKGMDPEAARAAAQTRFDSMDYIVNEKDKAVTLTASGIAKAEARFQLENLSDPENTTLSHYINQSIRAHGLMHRDVDYVVKDGEVIIVDEFTGRLMYGRRYSEGLHQAIEAKEHVTVARESKTLATITFQNYFRLYDKLAGMTGTAMTEDEEFATIYALDIVEIPTNRPVARIDHPDVVYKTAQGKYRAVVEQIVQCHEKGQPVLVGTVSIEKSEIVSRMLEKRGIKHNVLNAKNHEKEAEIVAQAGKFGAVTVATNMAGRGTDIMLGGNAEYLAKADLRKAGLTDELIAEATGFAETDDEEILAARKMFQDAEAKYKDEIRLEADKVRAVGGLFILGTERHESRRIDNQLRGRAGRQGDPGETRFYLSLEDDVLRLFGGDSVAARMDKLGIDEDTPIEQGFLTKAIERAQKTIESKNFQTRKSVLDYDDVMNTQREVIYSERRKVLDGQDLQESIRSMIQRMVSDSILGHAGEQGHMTPAQFKEATSGYRGLFFRPSEFLLTEEELKKITPEELVEQITQRAFEEYAAKEQELGMAPNGEPLLREVERVMLLRTVDEYWMDNLDAMNDLKQGIGLRGYGQYDPVVEYKREGYAMFEEMIAAIQHETVRRIYSTHLKQPIQRQRVAKATGESGASDGTVQKQPTRKKIKVGRNDPCPCGSGLKWKKCTCAEYHQDSAASE